MLKVMDVISAKTDCKSYNTYKYRYDSIGLPSIEYDDDSKKIMKWQEKGETVNK